MIVQICAGLVNFQNPLLKEMEEDFNTLLPNNEDTRIQPVAQED
jgi:hypothetical protein